MNKVLVITGDLATGKSTYANILSRKLNTLLLMTFNLIPTFFEQEKVSNVI